MQYNVQVYGMKNVLNGKMNIGRKSPNGKDYQTYITSVKSEEFWQDYAHGLIKKTLLFEGAAEQDNVAKTLEWFALNYGMKTRKEMFYNASNNAHCVDESLLTLKMKKRIVDYIEGREVENIEKVSNRNEHDKRIMGELLEDIKGKKYQIHNLHISEIKKFSTSQVRVEELDWDHVRKIAIGMEEDPVAARKIFGPIVIAVQEDGNRIMIDGNSRFAAAQRVKGWEILPVVFINESVFGDTVLQRINNYKYFGNLANSPESPEVRKYNTSGDLKKMVIDHFALNGFKMNTPLEIERSRKEMYERFDTIAKSKHKLNGVFQSILSDVEKDNASLTYQGNMKSYSEKFFEEEGWVRYGDKGIAFIHTTASKMKYAECLGYIFRRMRNMRANKGAIMIHFISKKEYAECMKEGWIQDLEKVIQHSNLPITLDILPAFVETDKKENELAA